MAQFVTPDDYKRKPTSAPHQAEGAGKFASKKATTEGGDEDQNDTRSQLELATSRVAKFIPSFLILSYVGFCNLVNSKDAAKEADLRLLLFQIAFWLCLVSTPLYIAYFERKNPLRWRNIIVGTLAFLIWAYAFPCGWFVDIRKYDPVIAAFILMAFSLVTALIPAPKLDGK